MMNYAAVAGLFALRPRPEGVEVAMERLVFGYGTGAAPRRSAARRDADACGSREAVAGPAATRRLAAVGEAAARAARLGVPRA